MSIFDKKVKFISAICPECKGHLELDSSLKTAFCQYCGAQCIVENAPKREKTESKLETVLNFVERQQLLRRQDKRADEQRAEEEERQRRALISKYAWVYILLTVALFAFAITMAILESQGVI